MSRDQLIDLITNEVLKIVKNEATPDPSGGGASGGGASGGGGGGGLRDPLRPAPAPVPAASGLGTDPLLVVCGNHLSKSSVTRVLPRLRERHRRVGAILSPAARELFNDSKRIFAGLTVDVFEPAFTTTLKRHTSVTILNASVNTLAKLAHLIADTAPTVAVFLALKEGIPVRLVTDPLSEWKINTGVTARIDSYLREIEAYGIHSISEDALLSMDSGPSAPLPTGPNEGPDADTDCRTCAWAGHCAVLCPDRVSAVVDAGAVRVASLAGSSRPSGDVPGLIDHTLLKPDATEDQIRTLCDEASRHQFMSVCVNPGWVGLCHRLLKGSGVKVCTVVGFPLGATSTASKEGETRDAIRNGADEIDMVINVGALKAGNHGLVLDDIKAVVRGAQGRVTKVILETALLTEDEKRRACELAKDAGADFVKTSTGFGPGGATVEDIRLMRQTVGPRMGVKASGGVRDLAGAQAMIEAGATRIGASASVAIAQQSKGLPVTGSGGDYGYSSPAKSAPASTKPTCG